MGIGCTTLTSWHLWKFTTDQIPTIPYIACVIILMYWPVTVTARFFFPWSWIPTYFERRNCTNVYLRAYYYHV